MTQDKHDQTPGQSHDDLAGRPRQRSPDRGETARDRDAAAARRRERERRIGAAQIAAPSTRRWRRSGRFEQPA